MWLWVDKSHCNDWKSEKQNKDNHIFSSLSEQYKTSCLKWRKGTTIVSDSQLSNRKEKKKKKKKKSWRPYVWCKRMPRKRRRSWRPKLTGDQADELVAVVLHLLLLGCRRKLQCILETDFGNFLKRLFKEQDLCFFKRFVLLASDGWFFYAGVLKFLQDGEINVIFFPQYCSIPLP